MPTFLTRFAYPILVTLICCALVFAPSAWFESLIFNRQGIAEGEVWRLFTGNLLHSNNYHLLLNMLGMWVFWYVYYDLANVRWQGLFLLLPMVGCTLLLWSFNPEMQRYVGMSGALHGLVVCFAAADLFHNRRLSILVLLGVAVKIAAEQIMGPSASLEVMIGARVAIDAHLWGALSGALVAIVYCLKTWRSPKPSTTA